MRSRVVRDDNGFVWLGTVNGLERYDGNSFKDYRNNPDDPSSLSSNTIMSLLVDRKQRLWVGTFETGLSLFDAGRDRFLSAPAIVMLDFVADSKRGLCADRGQQEEYEASDESES